MFLQLIQIFYMPWLKQKIINRDSMFQKIEEKVGKKQINTSQAETTIKKSFAIQKIVTKYFLWTHGFTTQVMEEKQLQKPVNKINMLIIIVYGLTLRILITGLLVAMEVYMKPGIMLIIGILNPIFQSLNFIK